MTRYFILSVLSLIFAISASAQDDDMYFTPKKISNVNTVQRPLRSEVTEAYNYSQDNNNSGSTAYYSGSIRDVDEYNRRNHSNDEYAQGLDDSIIRQDSILVSRVDYENSMKMKRFDGYNNITLVVNDPWYYDSWYDNPFYWRSRWYDPWYYSCYDYGYYGPHWYGYWGGCRDWGWGYSWYNPIPYRPIWNGIPSYGNSHTARSVYERNATRNNTSTRYSNRGTYGNSNRNTSNSNRSNYNDTNRSTYGTNRGTYGTRSTTTNNNNTIRGTYSTPQNNSSYGSSSSFSSGSRGSSGGGGSATSRGGGGGFRSGGSGSSGRR